jgi:hypothetical protein
MCPYQASHRIDLTSTLMSDLPATVEAGRFSELEFERSATAFRSEKPRTEAACYPHLLSLLLLYLPILLTIPSPLQASLATVPTEIFGQPSPAGYSYSPFIELFVARPVS